MAGRTFAMAFTLAASLAPNFSAAFGGAHKQVEGLKKSIENLQKTQSRLDAANASGVINAKSYENAMKQYQSAQNTLRGQAFTQAGVGIASDMMKAHQAISSLESAFGAPIRAAIKFESVMADVKKVVDFDTPKQFEEMGKAVLDLSTRIPMTAEGLGQIVAAGGQSGIARDELVAFAESAAKMGVAFDITADQAGDMMAKWRTAFKMGQADVIVLADKVNYLGNTTAASAPLISDVVTRIGPLGEVGGLASGEIAAMGASLVGSGIQFKAASLMGMRVARRRFVSNGDRSL